MSNSQETEKEIWILPPKTAEAEPWQIVQLDLIGQYEVETPKETQTLRALTMIDLATGWFEIAEYADEQSATITDLFNNMWLTCYLRQ